MDLEKGMKIRDSYIGSDTDLKELSDILDDLYEECEVDKFVVEYLEQLTQEQIDSIRVYEPIIERDTNVGD